LDSHWAILKIYWQAAGKCPNNTVTQADVPIGWVLRKILEMRPSADMIQGRSAQRLSTKKWQFPSLASEVPPFCLHSLKFEVAVKNCKSHLQFFYSFLSNNTTFSQIQTGVVVYFKHWLRNC
jgi:hypothetical protein